VVYELTRLPPIHILDQQPLSGPVKKRCEHGAVLRAGLPRNRAGLLSKPSINQVSERRRFAFGDLEEACSSLLAVGMFELFCLLRDLAQKFILVSPQRLSIIVVVDDDLSLVLFASIAPRNSLLVQVR
jgi:hypothetical protein